LVVTRKQCKKQKKWVYATGKDGRKCASVLGEEEGYVALSGNEQGTLDGPVKFPPRRKAGKNGKKIRRNPELLPNTFTEAPHNL
jgi:hypothetical protein